MLNEPVGFGFIALIVPFVTDGIVPISLPKSDVLFATPGNPRTVIGRPIVDSEGTLLGVATYGISSTSGNYNIGISSEEVTKMLTSKEISVIDSVVTEHIHSGVNNLQKSYYKNAVVDFEKAVELYPESESTLATLLSISKKKISDGEDRTPFINVDALESNLKDLGIKLNGNSLILAIVAFGGLVISAIVLITVIVIRRKRERSKTPPVVGNYQIPPQTASPEQYPPQPVVQPLSNQAPPPIVEQTTADVSTQPEPQIAVSQEPQPSIPDAVSQVQPVNQLPTEVSNTQPIPETIQVDTIQETPTVSDYSQQNSSENQPPPIA